MNDAETIARLTAQLKEARAEIRGLRQELEAQEPCEVCHQRAATKLCDRILGSTDDFTEYHSCDLPMCDGCAHVEAHWHWHGGSEGGWKAPKGGSDTMDLCPNHLDTRDTDKPITLAELDRLRAAARILPVP